MEEGGIQNGQKIPTSFMDGPLRRIPDTSSSGAICVPSRHRYAQTPTKRTLLWKQFNYSQIWLLFPYISVSTPPISFYTSSSTWILPKVSKSRKQLWKLSILPKNERKTWKNYPKSSQDNFFSGFVRFFGRIENSNFFFEIYWPLECLLLLF